MEDAVNQTDFISVRDVHLFQIKVNNKTFSNVMLFFQSY